MSVQSKVTTSDSQSEDLAFLDPILESIKQKFVASQKQSFDLFTSLISSTIWQSPSEIVKSWISAFAKEEWNALQVSTGDTPEMIHIKHEVRKDIVNKLRVSILQISQHPTTLQRYTTRLLIREKMAQLLPYTDQDRVIATELGLSHEGWSNLLGFLSILKINYEQTSIIGAHLSINSNGDTEHHLLFGTFPGSDLTLPTDIDGVSIQSRNSLSLHTSERGLILVPGQQILMIVQDTTLKRYTSLLSVPEEEKAVRKEILFRTQIPVWKRRGGGGNKPEKEERELEPAWQMQESS